ncbi:uncharacterized protein LOC112050268 [Bicyclus anynana]|uniref:Uncharacterized protein LOC112050268 n=1 Tax=Bicyclus anynana TaxID=110368 RepID=A0ABM3LLK1_BICAN|nr:uncharacterized protein LOC112050268 [Bicyclus anynana]
MTSKNHNHPTPKRPADNVIEEEGSNNTAVVITSRKGKEMLLYRKYTYRKQYTTSEKCRWVCSTKKNCHSVVFTDMNNVITSTFESHSHDPPKYYLNPNNLLGAIRERLVLEVE